MTEISEILRGRSDLSAFVVHLTRGPDPEENVKNMLQAERIEARNPHGWDKHVLGQAGVNAVCFTETPLEHLTLLCGEIQGRAIQLSEWGLAFTKYTARLFGANPVAYVHGFPNEGGGPNQMANALDRLRDALMADIGGGQPMTAPLRMAAQVVLSGSQKMSRVGTTNEWWWEREWRKIEDFEFDFDSLAFGLCPPGRVLEMEEWSADVLEYGLRWISPSWTVEETIGHLADVREDIPPWPRQRY